MEKRSSKIITIAALGLSLLALSSCRNDHDPWFNTYYFQEGDFYLIHTDGYTLDKSISFDDCYFRVRSVEDEEGQEAYEKLVYETAPDSYWLGMNLPEYSVKQIDWMNCYLHEMPGFEYAYTGDAGLRFKPIQYLSNGEPTAWRRDYAELYEKSSSEYPIYLDLELHKEDLSLTGARAHFVIEGVCDLLITFNFVSIY